MTDSSGRRPSALRETVAWIFGRRRRVRVVGDSMTPTLTPGQFVLVDTRRRPDPGDLALARHPDQEDILVVKRVGSITGDGDFVLMSDNPVAGTDSRKWGPLGSDRIEGTVTLLLDQPSAPLSGP